MARLHWRPDLCRRHPRPPRSQRPPHRSRRRQPEAKALQIDHKGLTTGLQLAKKRQPARRHHLVSPGDIVSESAGDFVGIRSSRKFALDSALEGDGFEPSVPGDKPWVQAWKML